MPVAGVDVGSVAAKAVVLDEKKKDRSWAGRSAHRLEQP